MKYKKEKLNTAYITEILNKISLNIVSDDKKSTINNDYALKRLSLAKALINGEYTHSALISNSSKDTAVWISEANSRNPKLRLYSKNKFYFKK